MSTISPTADGSSEFVMVPRGFRTFRAALAVPSSAENLIHTRRREALSYTGPASSCPWRAGEFAFEMIGALTGLH
jgi:hypothetical protein